MATTVQPSAGSALAPRLEWSNEATIIDVFADRVATLGARSAMRVRDDHDRWRTISWAEYGRRVAHIAAGLREFGIAPGDRVGILSWNRPEWHEADMAILQLGAVAVPIYPTSSGEQVGYMLEHSGCRVCFVEGAEALARVSDQREIAKALERVVVFEEDVATGAAFACSFDELREIGVQALERTPEPSFGAQHRVRAGDVATLVYTSGTTGPPKGAVITHANVMATLRAVTKVVGLSTEDRFLSFLPLSHITERAVSHWGLIAAGGETWFARSISTVADDLPECRPTIFFAVPRVWEKFQEGIREQVEEAHGVERTLAEEYLSLAPLRARELETGEYMPFHRKVEWLALDRIVGARIRRGLGLDRARVLASGAAPVHPDLLRWFRGIGLEIAEGYGQTEVALATALNPPGAIRIGTVGPPLPGVTVRIADDGEVLVHGDNVCAGYWQNEKGTKELIDDDGWLHSGDLGAFDSHGYLKITGRKKDLIITAHGKNIAPQVLETDLKQASLIGQAVVIGDGQRYLTALIALDPDASARWAIAHHKPTDMEALAHDPDLAEEIGAAVNEANERHARVEWIRKWRIIPNELTVSGGELTPTLKVKRATVNERYADLISEMYAEVE
jgi:long-chain acyl-CoA synthetase